MNPLVSICIPVYNGQQFIKDCIESILNQTFDDYEIVVVDNDSSDSTCEIIESFNNKRIRLIRNSRNIGMEANWNKSLQLARGELIKLLCADDIIYPNCVSSQVDILQCPINFDVSLVTGLRNILRKNGQILIKSRGLRGISGKISYAQIVKLIFKYGTNPIGEPATVMFRKKDFLKIGRFSAHRPYLIDLDFWIKLLGLGMLYVLPSTIAGFRISESSASVSMSNSQAQEFGFLLKELFLSNLKIVAKRDYIKARLKCNIKFYLCALIFRFCF